MTLVGQGCFLTAIRGCRRPEDRIQVFQAPAIHMIRPARDFTSLLVVGGKSVSRLDLSTEQLAIVAKETVLSDWIWDCAESGDSLLFLTAHNRVVVTDLDLTAVKTFAAEEKCILYSGLLRNTREI